MRRQVASQLLESDSGQHRMAGSGRFLGGVGFRSAHLAHTNDLRIKAQSHVQ